VLVSAAAQNELIPGYVATQRLGAGGYGEVWKVDAPGGLQKAIKIIYGYLTEERATRELKALENIKMVRHPFLLSLERIEVIDGRLMIVTELADMSLVDRFEQCRKENLVGIPREELLNYLQDAADALDYMLHTHSLQHLDVKPENLLLVAGRTKVADFGLVKEIADKTRSLVGAMTPTYAAPEVFEGKATRTSDQYSLAIVFQEMLTGVLPFAGRTSGQLAAQHANNRPQLGALPHGDRDIIARALSKRAQDRFASCRELINALRGSHNAPAAPMEAPSSRQRDEHGTRAKQLDDTRTETCRPGPAPDSHTEIIGAPGARPAPPPVQQTRPSTAIRQCSGSRRRSTAREEVIEVAVARTNTDLPPLEAAVSGSVRPAMFIGVGKTGLVVLEKLFGRLCERWGASAAQEAFPMLVFDSDSASLKTGGKRFDSQNVVHMPLRQAHEYRNDADELLGWLDRRWLYNLPKSGETQGMRPWGRLAVLDHAATLVSKLRPRLAALTNGTVAKALAATTKEEPRAVSPRVFIVGSCCGGAGGGAMLELAYAVRNVTKRIGADQLEIFAVITNSTNQCPAQAQLGMANTVAFLTELQHYARCGAEGMAGSTTRTAIFESNEYPLNQVYYIPFGHELTTEAYEESAAAVADYLYCDVSTPLGSALDACRQPQPEGDLQIDVKLRSFRLARFDGLGEGVLSSLATHLVAEAANHWVTHVGEKQSVAERYLAEKEGEEGAKDANYTLRLLAGSMAVAWYDQHESTIIPPAASRRLEGQVTSQRQALKKALLDQLLAIYKNAPRAEASAELATFCARISEQQREDRIEHYWQMAADRALQTYLRAAAKQLADPKSPPPPSLLEILTDEAQKHARILFCELTPNAEIAADGTVRASSRPALAYMDQRLQAQFPYGCQRRLFLMSPWQASDDPAQRRHTHLEATEPNAFVCEELEGISLGQIVHDIIDKFIELPEIVEHLHSRIDIDWGSCATPVFADEP
jgi:serine/threonine protein kinase